MNVFEKSKKFFVRIRKYSYIRMLLNNMACIEKEVNFLERS
jgi:hypothetical protein